MSRKQQNNGPAFQEFDRRVRKLTAIGWDRQRAVASVAAKDPELHRAMVAETSPGTDPRILQAVANGQASIVPPIQRPGVTAKQTAPKPLAGTATRQTAPQATSAPAAPVAPAAAATVAPATHTPAKSSAVAAYEANEVLLNAALEKRRAKGLFQSDAVCDLLASDDAHLWHESIRLYRLTLPPDQRIAV